MPAVTRWKRALFIALFSVAAAVFVPGFSRWASGWARFAPDVPLTGAEAWRLLPASPDEGQCPADARESKDCPANPANKALWTSSIFRRVEGGIGAHVSLRLTRPREYWVGAVIPADLLYKAHLAGANKLLLG